MMEKKQPPKFLDDLLAWYCKEDLLEDLQGDLHEYYYRNLSRGKRMADLIYFLDVIKFFRLYTTRKPKLIGQMNFFNMMGNYFKTTTRSMARNKLFSFINVIGLAISMSIGILMISYISELLSYDTFHEKGDRIYRVLTNYKSVSSEDALDLASTSIFIGNKLKEDYTGFEDLVIMRRNLNVDIENGENIISANGLWTTEDFFDLFSFELLSGNPATCLTEPNSIVIAESVAKKLFPDESPIGKVVPLLGQEHYKLESATITGVVADPPKNSHIQFELLGSFSTLQNYAASLDAPTTFFNSYSSIWMNYVYMSLPAGQSPEVVQKHLNQVAAKEAENHDRFAIKFELEPLNEIMPGRDLSNQIGPSMQWEMIYIFAVLTLVVVISACFNYTNLSVAKSLRRAKEVGIRKVVGAGRSQVFGQFLFEAIFISFIALILSFGLYLIIRPEFLELISEEDVANLKFRPIQAIYFVLFALITGFLAGIIPSIIISKLKPISVLRDVTRLKLFSGVNLRKVLLVVQFALSIGFIIAATISYRQYEYSLNFDLGFKTENVLNIDIQGDYEEVLYNRLSELPEVSKISRSGMVPGIGEVWGETAKYKDPLDSTSIFLNYIDRDYVSIHGYELLAGESFPYENSDSTMQLALINEKLLKRFNFETPEAALGEFLIIDQGETKLRVIGVVRDFHYSKISDEIQPVALIQDPENYQVLNLKLASRDMVTTLGKIESIWNEVDPVHPFNAKFYDDQIQRAYQEYRVYFQIIGFLAFLAISIASLGLLGMAVFTTETRMKEVSIRKVLGASEKGLIILLSKGFVVLLLISAAIAVPVTYLLFDTMILADMVNRVDFGILELSFGVFVIFGIGFLTIGWQTFRAARTNPAEMLRDE